MKKFLFIVALLVQQIDVLAVTVETTVNLNVYYPDYTKIDLVCGQMPKAAQKDVEFCCEAAFTGELLNEFKHSNIADNHICNGEMKKGYRCKANTGGFVWGNGKCQFVNNAKDEEQRIETIKPQCYHKFVNMGFGVSELNYGLCVWASLSEEEGQYLVEDVEDPYDLYSTFIDIIETATKTL